jgi:hypothetical protein
LSDIDVVVSGLAALDTHFELTPQLFFMKHVDVAVTRQYRRAEVVGAFTAGQGNKGQHRHHLVPLGIALAGRGAQVVEQWQANGRTLGGGDFQAQLALGQAGTVPDMQHTAAAFLFQGFLLALERAPGLIQQHQPLALGMVLADDLDNQLASLTGRARTQAVDGGAHVRDSLSCR